MCKNRFSKGAWFCEYLNRCSFPLTAAKVNSPSKHRYYAADNAQAQSCTRRKRIFLQPRGVKHGQFNRGGSVHTWANGTNSMVDRNMGEIPLPVSMTVNTIILPSSSALSRFSSWSLILIVP